MVAAPQQQQGGYPMNFCMTILVNEWEFQSAVYRTACCHQKVLQVRLAIHQPQARLRKPASQVISLLNNLCSESVRTALRDVLTRARS